jgi:hypothetical protein
MEQSEFLFCSSEFPHKIISSKFIENLSTRPKKVSPEHNLKLQNTYKSFYPSGLCCMTQLKK